jgi:predicted transcriptional regulator
MRIERPHVLVRTIGKEDVMQATLEQIRRLERLYAEGYEDSFLDRSLRKIIAHQVARDQADLAGLEKGLAELAARYNMDFEEFYTRYREGQLGMM